MADTVLTVVKTPTSWKIKIALGVGVLVTLVVLGFMFRVEAGIVMLAIGLSLAARLAVQAKHEYTLSKLDQRRQEAETQKVEYEALKAKAESYFVETVSGVFTLEGIAISRFYPSATASRTLADVPLLPASTESYRKLLDVDFIHLLVTGPSDAGKTTVLCHLIDNSPFDTVVYVLDPHAKFNRWPNRVNEVIGHGRDYQAVDSKLVSLIAEMDRRYNSNKVNFQRVLIIADEWLGILEHCPNALKFFNTIGSEARKVAMSLVVSSISMTVDDLDVSGAIRDNLAQLTLTRTLKAQNLGEIKWSRADKELVELPGRYVYREPMLPATVETVEQFEPMPILDDGPRPFTPTSDELKVYELHLQGKSYRQISMEIYGSVGGRQVEEIKQILSKFGVSV